MRLLSLVAPPLCTGCRRPAVDGAVLCPNCRRVLEHLGPGTALLAGVEVWAAVAYEGPARAVVRRLKFGGATALADHMAAVIAANAPPGMLGATLAPVPSPPARRRARGFCHATLLAEALAARTGSRALPMLERVGSARRQVGRARGQRLGAPPAFEAVSEGGDAVVLVDDVVTTGATLGACAQALRGKGWHCDQALAYARTPVR